MDLWSLFVGFLMSLIGVGLLMYGRREGRVPHMVVGLVLVVAPYVVGGVPIEIGLTVLLLAGLALFSRLGY